MQNNYDSPDQESPKQSYPSIDWTEIFTVELVTYIKPDPFTQLVCFPKADATQAAVAAWADKNFRPGEVRVISLCGNCDTSLVLLDGQGVKTFIQGTVMGGSTNPIGSPPIQGAGSPVYLSPNYGVALPRTPITGTIPLEALEPLNLDLYENKLDVIDVAVLDTGLKDVYLDTYLYSGNSNPCILNAEDGWNFVARTAAFDDDNPELHGTSVSSYIIEQAITYLRNPVRILPVKVHNAEGISDLFNILCAFAYAKQRGAKIINASFGFYAPRRCSLGRKEDNFESVFLLHEFIEKYITDDILLIAAAGNQDATFFDPYFRNLDHISFYPASFARTNRNVFAVTTVYKKDVSPIQNFSPNTVDIGVVADTEDFLFKHPLNQAIGEAGSSFAAPILAGKIAANYSFIKEKLGTKKFSKKNILKVMKQELLASKNYKLKGKIKNGLTIQREKVQQRS